MYSYNGRADGWYISVVYWSNSCEMAVIVSGRGFAISVSSLCRVEFEVSESCVICTGISMVECTVLCLWWSVLCCVYGGVYFAVSCRIRE
jgi:hypothetical protein